MKKSFELPEINVMMLDVKDVITASEDTDFVTEEEGTGAPGEFPIG